MTGKFPAVRPRRTRQAPWIRRLVRETVVTPDDFIQPLFVVEGEGIRKPIAALPGVDHLSIDRVVETARAAHGLGIPALALFPVIASNLKDPQGKLAIDPNGLIPRCVRAVKA